MAEDSTPEPKRHHGQYKGVITAPAGTAEFKGGVYEGSQGAFAMRASKPITDPIPCGYVEITESLDRTATRHVGTIVPFFSSHKNFKIGDEVEFDIRARRSGLPGSAPHAVNVREFGTDISHADKAANRQGPQKTGRG